MTNLTLSQACAGMTLYKTAAGLSPRTLTGYRNSFNKLALFLPDDPPFTSITRAQLIAFFAWLQTEYTTDPDGVAPRGRIRLSPKSIYNIHTDLSALWRWAVEEGYVSTNLIRTIAPPPFEHPAIQPLTRDEIQALLKACDNSRTWKTRATSHRRPTADRDRAILLLLLDTGIRAQELCDIRLNDLNLTANTIRIHGKGRGRDKKERTVHFGKRTARALWRHLTPRLQTTGPGDPIFTVGPADEPRPLARDVLRKLIKRLGQRAGIQSNVYTHRFRHTFAITYLRNGGDIFTLQILLGHSSLEMVKRYLAIVRSDCADAHKRASPVDNWRL